MDGSRQLLINDAGVDAVALVQEVVLVSLAAAVVEELALAAPHVVEVSTHPVAEVPIYLDLLKEKYLLQLLTYNEPRI